MNNLDKRIEDATVEKALRYPLIGIRDNLTELRLIGESAQDYITTLNPDLIRPGRWEVIPQIAMDFLKEVYRYLGERKRTDVSEVYLDLGDIMRVSIEYTATAKADKEGTLNPKIVVGNDMLLETTEYNDDITFEQAEILRADECAGLPAQFFENRKVIKDIAMAVKPKLMTQYGIKISDSSWTAIPCAFVAFFRCAKKWLTEHKDDGPRGVDINVGNIVSIGIEKEGLEGEEPDYFLFITPGQVFKHNYAKGDNDTETKEEN